MFFLKSSFLFLAFAVFFLVFFLLNFIIRRNYLWSSIQIVTHGFNKILGMHFSIPRYLANPPLNHLFIPPNARSTLNHVLPINLLNFLSQRDIPS
ncbi:hypothetical protein CXF67_16410 [Psychroflexus sp. MES1-P1E]|nr:hypothetical protein CXF67_16410 [Psychroflexus sp. MES1-P1E]